jgi:1-acyl-sn-glycerol-3-phosphate acyltransferase
VRESAIRLRAVARIVGAALVTLPAYLLALSGAIFLAPWPGPRVRVQGVAFRFWSRGLCRVFGVRVKVEGARPPRPPFFLVSNHLSYLDIIVLGTQLPCVFVAKSEIDGWPLFGALCRSVNTIYVDRKAKRKLPEVIAQIEQTLAAGQGVVIFPEGTSGAGHEVLPFRSPLLELPARMSHPVRWAAISYRSPAGATPTHLSVTWWGDMPLGAHLKELTRLDWIEAPIRFGAEPIAHGDRKQLAETHYREISGAFVPLVDRAEVERLLALKESDPAALPAVMRGSHEAEF